MMGTGDPSTTDGLAELKMLFQGLSSNIKNSIEGKEYWNKLTM
jgi:hypothetical protein